MGRHVERSNVYYTRPAPTKGIANCEMRKRIENCGIEKIGYLHISQFAFRLSQFLLVVAQNHGQAQGPAPTRYVPMNMVRNEDIGQINRRGNPLWLPQKQGRHGGLPLRGPRGLDEVDREVPNMLRSYRKIGGGICNAIVVCNLGTCYCPWFWHDGLLESGGGDDEGND